MTPTTITNSFGKKALLVRFTQHKWSANKEDKQASKDVKKEKEAKANADVKVMKKLIDDKAFEKLGHLVGEAYRYHISVTVPYMYRGTGMLPIVFHAEYTKKMREFKEALAQAKRDVRNNLPKIIENEQNSGRLGRLFRIEDYPMDKIADYFDFDISFFPVPESGHFVVDVQNEAIDEIKEAFANAEKDAIKEVSSDLWARLFKVVKNMDERLSDPKSKIYDSLVGNITELCGILPALNLAGDNNLDNMVREIENRLTAHEPDTLKTNKKVRKEVAASAKEILTAMEGFI